MVESIIPGTYITVRSEGLISAGRVATGIVGIVGTASSGPINEPVTLAGFADAQAIFGAADDYRLPKGAQPLTLIRALEHLYNNGASSVIAVRVAGPSQSKATYAVLDAGNNTIATLTAATPGTWGNDINLTVEAAGDPASVVGELHNATFDNLNYGHILVSPQNRIRYTNGTSRQSFVRSLQYKRVIKNEVVEPNADSRYIVENLPVEDVASVNEVVVLEDDAVVRTYGDGAILIGAGGAPAVDEVRITDSGEIVFEATQVPTAGQQVRATYAVGYAAALQSGEILVTTWSGELEFPAGEEPNAGNGDTIEASYLVDKDECVLVTLTHGVTAEGYTVPDGRLLVQQITPVNGTGGSSLVTAELDGGNGSNTPKTGVSDFFGTGSNSPGGDGSEAAMDEYAAGLDAISNMLVNIVVLAGQHADTMAATLEGHLNATENVNFERIGVIGAAGNTPAQFMGHNVASDRIILVAPGMTVPDRSGGSYVLPSAYTAAAVAGLISSSPVQTSLTNKVVTVSGLQLNANRAQQEQMIRRNLLTLVSKSGYRVLKGVTTAGEGTPFSSIPTRRIVDYAKYGVRSAANPYIGRLNNSRVRAALKATLDAFLTRMVEDEALTGYELDVTATRAQEIAGEVLVSMTLQPTFSIDYIRVIMNLQ